MSNSSKYLDPIVYMKNHVLKKKVNNNKPKMCADSEGNIKRNKKKKNIYFKIN